MSTHWKAVVALLTATLTSVIVGSFWSPYLGLGAFMAMILVLFLLGITWMNPRDSQQRAAEELERSRRTTRPVRLP